MENLSYELVEKIKTSFYDINNLSGLININIIGFILLTIVLLFYISEGFFLRTIKVFYPDNENYKKTGVYIAYRFFRKVFLYISLIFMSIILINRNVWIISLGKYIEVFNFFMLLGFIFILSAVVINFVKIIEEKKRELIFLSLLISGYIVYIIGLTLGLNIY